RRRLELRAPARGVRRLLHPVPGAAAGDQAGRPLPEPAAVRDVPLARDGPDPLRGRPARHHPGPGLAPASGRPGPLSAAAGRHRLSRLLVPGGAARIVPVAAGADLPGGDLTGARRQAPVSKKMDTPLLLPIPASGVSYADSSNQRRTGSAWAAAAV